MHIKLKNSAGVVKDCKVGFSWTMLFFGLFVPIIRGDLKWAILSILLSAITLGFGWLVFPFIYNKIYIKDLLEKGYSPAEESDMQVLRNKGIIAETA